MSRNPVWGRLAMLGIGRPREAPHGYDFNSNSLCAETDSICPRCLEWIAPDSPLRRTAYGLLQHEACPVIAVSGILRSR